MKVYYVDIDGTICTTVFEDNYQDAKPIKEHIDKINRLYDRGHRIIYWTARGSTTGKDWGSLTRFQLQEWGVKYHRVEFGKPCYDVFICDKATTIENLEEG